MFAAWLVEQYSRLSRHDRVEEETKLSIITDFTGSAVSVKGLTIGMSSTCRQQFAVAISQAGMVRLPAFLRPEPEDVGTALAWATLEWRRAETAA